MKKNLVLTPEIRNAFKKLQSIKKDMEFLTLVLTKKYGRPKK